MGIPISEWAGAMISDAFPPFRGANGKTKAANSYDASMEMENDFENVVRLNEIETPCAYVYYRKLPKKCNAQIIYGIQ